jgi:flagellar export protein FliJ
MKRFSFRLNSVLLLRRRLLNEAEEAYTKAIQARMAVEEQLNMGNEDLNKLNSVAIASREAPVSGIQQQGFLHSLDIQKQRVNEIRKDLIRARAEENNKRKAYVEANRDFELLEKLRDRQKTKHFFNEQLKEQLIQDDLFNARRVAALNSQES